MDWRHIAALGRALLTAAVDLLVLANATFDVLTHPSDIRAATILMLEVFSCWHSVSADRRAGR